MLITLFNVFLKIIFRVLPVRIMDKLGNASLPSSDRAFRIFSRIDPSLFETMSARKLLYLFRKASRSIPAYSEFLRQHGIDPRKIRSIEDFETYVPPTSKKDYVQAFSLADRCVNGSLPEKGFLEESAGTSGASTCWIKSREEEENNQALSQASMKHLYGFGKAEKVVLLNGFILGGWSGGLRFSSRIGSLGILRNTGPDPRKIIHSMKELGAGYTFLIGGYPPFITELIEYGRNLNDFSWKNFTVHIFTGGEGFVEEWRDFASSRLKEGALIFSDYGAIDLDVGISAETPFSVALRKLILRDRELGKELLQSSRLPCFLGQYSPQKLYICEKTTVNNTKELEITVMNLKSAAPVIRYAIGDEGGIIGFAEICSMLEKRGYKLTTLRNEFHIPAIIPFPFLYIYGRSDGTVTINGAMISPSEIYEAIMSDNVLVSSINTFKLSVEPDAGSHMRLFIFLETRQDVEVTDALVTRCNDIIPAKMLGSNECLRLSCNKDPVNSSPVISVVPYQTGIFSEKDRKIKYVYLK